MFDQSKGSLNRHMNNVHNIPYQRQRGRSTDTVSEKTDERSTDANSMKETKNSSDTNMLSAWSFRSNYFDDDNLSSPRNLEKTGQLQYE